ncbi:hypothetical protein MHYP_G00085540 [Metynnis hypsauchen]
MKLQLTLVLICVLLPKALTLECNQCIPDMSGTCTDTQTTCPDRCVSATLLVSAAGVEQTVSTKDCAAAAECVNGNLNLGVVKRTINTQCCTADLCNSQNPAVLPFGSPNGKKCYTCINNDCRGTASCEGDQDRCISTTVLERDTARSRASPVPLQALTTLGFLATGSFQRGLADWSGISQSSLSRAMPAVLDGIICMSGDSGYALQTWLTTPLCNPQTDRERRYNSLHSRTWSVVERAIGQLKNRWRCLDRTGGMLLYRPEKVYCEGMWGPAQCCAQVCRAIVRGGGATSGPRARTNAQPNPGAIPSLWQQAETACPLWFQSPKGKCVKTKMTDLFLSPV